MICADCVFYCLLSSGVLNKINKNNNSAARWRYLRPLLLGEAAELIT